MEVVRDAVGSPSVRAVVDYAHTPEAIHAALAALRSTTPGALVCVTGAGGDRDRDKREAMGAAAAELADIVIVTDDNPRSEDPALIRAAVRHGAETAGSATGRRVDVVEVADRREAIAQAVARARASGSGATIALVGKGHESGQEIAGEIHPFDDRDELAAALRVTGGRS
jgi:UDP-N-acetylmuramoyl-L-alanyl-D-glutamate--2,6-diaminopimelate ligase